MIKKFIISFFLALTLTTSVAWAQTKESVIIDSHWGVAVGTGWVQDYPGAAQGRMRYLAIPTFKGKIFSIDRQDGVKGNIFGEDIVKFALSFSFLFPTDADKIPVRQGMPDLDWVFQIGPEMQVFLFKSEWQSLYLRLPLRFIATTDFDHNFQYRQWNFAPSLRHVYLLNGWGEIMSRLEVDYASEGFSDLFYQVDQKYATAQRPAYNAQRGLLEYIVGFTYSYNESFPWGYSIGANVYLMQNAANQESPLHLRSTNYSVLASMVRYF